MLSHPTGSLRLYSSSLFTSCCSDVYPSCCPLGLTDSILHGFRKYAFRGTVCHCSLSSSLFLPSHPASTPEALAQVSKMHVWPWRDLSVFPADPPHVLPGPGFPGLQGGKSGSLSTQRLPSSTCDHIVPLVLLSLKVKDPWKLWGRRILFQCLGLLWTWLSLL